MGFLYLPLTGCVFGGGLCCLPVMSDYLGFFLWLTHCVELADGDGITQVEK